MDGVMMRNGDVYGLAVRRQDSTIVGCLRKWVSILNYPLLRLPFIRGFPVLLETLYNGIGALNQSATISTSDPNEKLSSFQLVISMIVAVVMAAALFVVAPHFLSLVMHWLSIGADVEGLSFHLWDGFFKVSIFLGYLWLIARLPEIKAVLAYHGAEHKSIHAFEKADLVSAETASHMSRLHPRCGTTFLLFVITLSIIVHALAIPIVIYYIDTPVEIWKHLLTLLIKIFLIIPISAVSYELIRHAAKVTCGWQKVLWQTPGLILQKITTIEPNLSQLEVAVVALYLALDADDRQRVQAVPFTETDAA
ncbi:MAG: DUF1385 domain-containing protein [Desulfovibrionaceae bacterium]|nr:DUF1385 domain-containing protein [Desulfovibrionaceae bacterium]